MKREEALILVRKLPRDIREAIALVVETADVQGDYRWDGENSNYEDDVASTLNMLAGEIRRDH